MATKSVTKICRDLQVLFMVTPILSIPTSSFFFSSTSDWIIHIALPLLFERQCGGPGRYIWFPCGQNLALPAMFPFDLNLVPPQNPDWCPLASSEHGTQCAQGLPDPLHMGCPSSPTQEGSRAQVRAEQQFLMCSESTFEIVLFGKSDIEKWPDHMYLSLVPFSFGGKAEQPSPLIGIAKKKLSVLQSCKTCSLHWKDSYIFNHI
jgi:hypothetical protein